MKAFCCECGEPVAARLNAANLEWEFQRCPMHPTAQRIKDTTPKGWFDRARAMIAKAEPLGRVMREPVNTTYHREWMTPTIGGAQ